MARRPKNMDRAEWAALKAKKRHRGLAGFEPPRRHVQQRQAGRRLYDYAVQAADLDVLRAWLRGLPRGAGVLGPLSGGAAGGQAGLFYAVIRTPDPLALPAGIEESKDAGAVVGTWY